MSRLTRRERVTAVSAGLLLGAAVGFAGQFLAWGLPLEIGLCVVGGAGLGAGLANWNNRPR